MSEAILLDKKGGLHRNKNAARARNAVGQEVVGRVRLLGGKAWCTACESYDSVENAKWVCEALLAEKKDGLHRNMKGYPCK